MAEESGGTGPGGFEPPFLSGRASITDWAAKLGGDIGRDDHGDLVIRCPGPGHQPDDRSLSVWLDERAPQGFRVHSYSIRDDDFTQLRDYVRDTCNAPEWKPPAKSNGHAPHRDVVAHYVYEDPEGAPVMRVTRYVPKAFAQAKPDGPGGWAWGGIPSKLHVPYKLPETMEAIGMGKAILVPEGEKAVLACWSRGLPATCSPGGAGKWPKHFAKWFAGANVIVLADNDIPGRKHAELVRENLQDVAGSVRVLNLPGLPPGGDVVDFFNAGGDPNAILTLKEGPPKRGHTMTELWDMPFPPVKYAVPGLIAEGLTLLAGAPKRGKSWLALDLCVTIAMGGFTLGDRHCPEGDTLYCALEDSPRRIKDRVRKVLQLSDRAPGRATVWFGTDLPRLGAGCEETLREWLDEAADPRLIVIDTLNYIRPDRNRDEDPYSYDYRSAISLQKLAQEYSCAIIIVHHTRKTAADDYLESVSGTNGLTGGSDAVMVLERGGDGSFTLKGRGRDVEEFEQSLRFDKDECRWRVVGDATETRLSETRAAILKVLKEAGWFMGAGEIATQVNRSRNTVDQQLFKMVKAGEVIRAGRGKYGLPPDVFDGDREDVVVPLHGVREDDDEA
jgi:hypothetical protein